MSLGRNIRSRRLELDITLEKLAKMCGVSKATMCKYEKEQILNIPSDRVERIADALKLTPTELMGWSPVPACFENNRLLFEEIEELDDRQKSLVREYVAFLKNR